MEGVTVVSSFMFETGDVNTLLILTFISLLTTRFFYLYVKDCRYYMVALVTTAMLTPFLLFATMNVNIPWQHVTIDETVIAEEFFDSYKILDIDDGIYFVRPLDN